MATFLNEQKEDAFQSQATLQRRFFHTPEMSGKPNVIIAPGKKDPVLPINSCSRRIVPKLERES
jgi:hypothetical protein